MGRRIDRLRQKAKEHRKKLLLTLVVLSLLEVLFVASTSTLKEIIDSLPVAIMLSVVSEMIFTVGIALMAISAEQGLGLNPLRWRSRTESLIKEVRNSKLFLVGFWLNFIGALGTGLIWIVVIFVALPPSAWLLAWIPIFDILLTLTLRKVFIDLVSFKIRNRKHKERSVVNQSTKLE